MGIESVVGIPGTLLLLDQKKAEVMNHDDVQCIRGLLPRKTALSAGPREAGWDTRARQSNFALIGKFLPREQKSSRYSGTKEPAPLNHGGWLFLSLCGGFKPLRDYVLQHVTVLLDFFKAPKRGNGSIVAFPGQNRIRALQKSLLGLFFHLGTTVKNKLGLLGRMYSQSDPILIV